MESGGLPGSNDGCGGSEGEEAMVGAAEGTVEGRAGDRGRHECAEAVEEEGENGGDGGVDGDHGNSLGIGLIRADDVAPP